MRFNLARRTGLVIECVCILYIARMAGIAAGGATEALDRRVTGVKRARRHAGLGVPQHDANHDTE